MPFKNVFYTVLLSAVSFGAAAQQTDRAKRDSVETALQAMPGNKAKLTSFIIPAILMAYGGISLVNDRVKELDYSTQIELGEHHPQFAAHVDNFTQFAPLVAMYALDIAGVKARNNTRDQTGMAILSNGFSTLVVHLLKNGVGRLRPDGSSRTSFPSGHTATAFAGAELFYQEFKDTSVWYGVAGYTAATGTGILRMYNNKHWFSDVVMGAGIGMLSTKLTCLVYPFVKKTLGANSSTVVLPNFEYGHAGLYLSKTF